LMAFAGAFFLAILLDRRLIIPKCRVIGSG
jgi:hypothetical protein